MTPRGKPTWIERAFVCMIPLHELTASARARGILTMHVGPEPSASHPHRPRQANKRRGARARVGSRQQERPALRVTVRGAERTLTFGSAGASEPALGSFPLSGDSPIGAASSRVPERAQALHGDRAFAAPASSLARSGLGRTSGKMGPRFSLLSFSLCGGARTRWG